jgi:predicted Zn-dependent protease
MRRIKRNADTNMLPCKQWPENGPLTQRLKSVRLPFRVRATSKYQQFLVFWIWIALCIVFAVTKSLAQKPDRAVDSSLSAQLYQAINTAQQGNEKGALALTAALLEKHPGFVPALKLQGMLLERTGHSSEAWRAYYKALSTAPNDAELLLTMGLLRLTAGEYDQAIILLRRRLNLLPMDGESLYYLAQAYHLNGNDGLALRTIRDCVTVEVGNASAWQKYGELLSSSGDNPAALRWLIKARQSDSTLERIDYDIAVASFYNMDLPSAAKYSASAVDSHPNDTRALALFATVKLKLSEWQDAKAVFQRILALKSDDPASLLGLGQCELELGNFQTSIDVLDHLLEVDPTQIPAHFFLAKAFGGLGRVSEAKHEIDLHNVMMQQFSFTPPKQDAKRQKAVWDQAQKLLTDGRDGAALRLVRESFAGPSATRGSEYVFVGAVYLSMGNVEDALRNLNRALAIEPPARGAHTYQGILDLMQGDLRNAERNFQAELALDPNSRLARAELGEVRYRQGRWSDAVDQLTQSKTRTPRLLYLLCDSYFRLDKIASANLAAETLAAYARNEPGMMQGLIELLNRNGQATLAQRISLSPGP